MSRVRAGVATALGLSALLLLPVGRAAAVPTLVFDQVSPLTPGTISWDPAVLSGALVGKDIVFKTITGLGTPANNGSTLSCVGDCMLNFVTGTYAGSGIWNPGGSFILTGDLAGIGDDLTILTGTWTSSVTQVLTTMFVGQGVDTKDAGMLSYFGFPSDTSFSSTSTFITALPVVLNGAFSVNVTNADITNYAETAAVPEPGTMLLLGSGVSVLALRRRRKV